MMDSLIIPCYKSRFEATISGQFYGHLHQDTFSIYFDETDPSRANK